MEPRRYSSKACRTRPTGADLSFSLLADGGERVGRAEVIGGGYLSILPIPLARRDALAAHGTTYLDVLEHLARQHAEGSSSDIVLILAVRWRAILEACEGLKGRLDDLGSRVRVLSESPGRLDSFVPEAFIDGGFKSVSRDHRGLGARRIPVVALSYSKKIENTLADLGLGDQCYPIEHLDPAGPWVLIRPSADAQESMRTFEAQFSLLEQGLVTAGSARRGEASLGGERN